MARGGRYYGYGSDKDKAKVKDIADRDEQARRDSDSLRYRAGSAYEQANKTRVADASKRRTLYENAKKKGIFKGTFEEFNKFLNDQGVK